MTTKFDDFLRYTTERTDAPPIGQSWAEVAELFERHRAELSAEFERIDSAYLVPTKDASRTDFESWSETKRRAGNTDALRAYNSAVARGNATEAEKQRMLHYTGFGGFREIGLLPDAFPPEYVEASRIWAETAPLGKQPPDSVLDIIGRVKDQYFTSMDACRVGWELLTRAHGGAPALVLEPSTGIGRFPLTAPLGSKFTLVEFDPLMASMLKMIYPQHDVHSGALETWVPKSQPIYDAVIGNPPWPRRVAPLRAMDAPNIARNEDYFILRGASVLRAGGTLCFLLPASFLLGESHRETRARLLRGCAFRGAALLPSGTYPAVREGTFVFILVTRRSVLAELTEREQMVIAGRFRELPEAAVSELGGVWTASYRGAKSDTPLEARNQYLMGPLEPGRVHQVVISAMDESAAVVKPKPPKPVAPIGVAPTGVDTEVTVLVPETKRKRPERQVSTVDEGPLAERVRTWIRLVNSDPTAAEHQRQDLLQTVSLHLADYGMPTRPEIRAVVEDGAPARLLLTPVEHTRVQSGPDDESSLSEVVAWHCDRRGYILAAELTLLVGGDELEVARQAAELGLYLTFRQDGVRVQTRPHYLAGSATDRLAEIEAALAGIQEPTIRGRLASQKEEVLRLWQRKLLSDIDFNPRSSFVPLEALQEWVNSHAWEADRHFYTRTYGEQLPVLNKPDGSKDWDATRLRAELTTDDQIKAWPFFQLVSEFGQVQVSDDSPSRLTESTFPRARELLKWLLGYMNRTLMVEDDKGNNRRANVSDVALKLKIDREREEEFRLWLGTSRWAAAVEAEYNRLTSDILCELPTDPLPLPGKSDAIGLREHQYQIVRRSTFGGRPRSVLCAFDTGAGKTFSGIAIGTKWRAEGMTRRTLIVVPSSVLVKWSADSRTLFPNARIGVIGYTPSKKPGAAGSSDDQPTRLAKWLAFGAGAYDICIVSHSLFWRDLEARETDAADMVAKLGWAKKKAGEAVLEARRITRLLEGLREKLAADEAELAEINLRRDAAISGGYHRDGDHYDKDLNKVSKRVADSKHKIGQHEESLAGLPRPTDSEATAVAEWVREAVQSKPYRPRMRSVSLEAVDESLDLEATIASESENDSEDDGGDDDEENEEIVEVREPMPGLVAWDELGVDSLIVDEAHNFRSTFYPAERGGRKIEYCGQAEARKGGLLKTASAWDMAIKCTSVANRYGGTGGIVFLTATPVVNSPLELYNLVAMIAPALWEDHGIMHKEEFIDRYFEIDTMEVVKPKGDTVVLPALKGIKNRSELVQILAPILDRKTTDYLVRAGWIKKIPATVPHQAFIERDVPQFVLLRSLMAVLLTWAEKKADNDDPDEPKVESVLSEKEKYEAKFMWRVGPDGRAVRTGRAPEWDDVFGKDLEKSRKSVSQFRLIWMSMVDKVAMDPRMLQGILPRLAVEAEEERQRQVALKDYAEKKRRGLPVPRTPPRALKPAKWTAILITQAVLKLIDLDNALAPYEKRGEEFAPKIKAFAEYVRDNMDRADKRCAHVAFIDLKEMMPQVEDALVKIAKIPRGRIGRITGGKGGTPIPKRLDVSRKLNGLDEYGNDVKPGLDVVIGTSKAMAEGIDLQTRSCGVHHLTMPWVPSEVHQRNGRAVRQGNRVGEVDLRYYLTKKSYDAMRYDKVTRKAGWMDTLFDGTQDTGNPAVGSTVDLAEMVLSMLIEDETELQERLAKIRLDREERQRAERIRGVQKDWLKVNSYFQSARAQADQTTRAVLEHQSGERLERLAMQWSLPPEAVASVRQCVTYYDPVTEDVVRPGTGVFSDRRVARLVRAEVRGSAWLHWVRPVGTLNSEPRGFIETRDGTGERPEVPTIEAEAAGICHEIGRGGSGMYYAPRIGDLSSDLLPYAGRIWAAVEGRGDQARTTRGDFFFRLPGAGPTAVLAPSPTPDEGTIVLSKLIEALKTQPHEFVPRTAPNAFELWCTAVATGNLYVGVHVGNHYVNMMAMPVASERGATQTADEQLVKKLTARMFNRFLPGDVWKARQARLWR